MTTESIVAELRKRLRSLQPGISLIEFSEWDEYQPLFEGATGANIKLAIETLQSDIPFEIKYESPTSIELYRPWVNSELIRA